MAVIRATFFFEDVNKHGWSETIHNLAADLTTAKTRANNLMRHRRNCLGSSARITYIRVSDDLVKRDSEVIINPVGDQLSRVGPATQADIANTSLVVRIQANPLARRTLYMRGIPDDCVTNSGQYSPSPSFVNAFDSWAFSLIQDQWACRSRDGTTPRHNITSVTQDAVTGLVTLTTGTPHGVVMGVPFVIRGVKVGTALNGTWLPVAIVDTDTLRIILKTILPAGVNQGTIALLGYTLAPIIDAKVVRVSHRISGRPFDSPRGRRKARARA